MGWLRAFQEKQKVLFAVLSNLKIWKCPGKTDGGGKRKKKNTTQEEKQGISIAEDRRGHVSLED